MLYLVRSPMLKCGAGFATLMPIAWFALDMYSHWPSASRAENRPIQYAEETIVQKHLLKDTSDSQSLKIHRWGPHELSGTFGTTWPPRSRKVTLEFDAPYTTVRARYSAKNTAGETMYGDSLFVLIDGRVVHQEANIWGDDWLKVIELNATP